MLVMAGEASRDGDGLALGVYESGDPIRDSSVLDNNIGVVIVTPVESFMMMTEARGKARSAEQREWDQAG